MAFRPSLRSIWTLIMLAVVCYGLYNWCEVSRVQKKLPFYDEKIAAAKLMDKALLAYQEAKLQKGVFPETYGDTRLDAIIGQQFSVITTDFGTFESKLTSANPNMAAVAYELLAEADVKKGDWVAIGFSGDYPAMNTAVLCACEIIGATPVTITSVGASWWGANDPDFTWLDMEKLLNTKGIVHSKAVAASYGGREDMAVGLSAVGKDAIKNAVERNGLTFIQENSLPSSIARRNQLFQAAASNQKYKVYINVGNGEASLGNVDNGKLIPTGYNNRLPIANYSAQGLVHLFNQNKTSVINLFDIKNLSEGFGLGTVTTPLPQVGQGKVFVAERYNLQTAGISAALALILIVILVKLDSRLFKLKDEGVDPDTLV